MTNENDGAARGVWDRIWRGRASSHRRILANLAAEAARIATLVAEGARLVDHLPTSHRQMEILGICDELTELVDAVRAVVTHLRAESGNAVPAVSGGFWRRLFRG